MKNLKIFLAAMCCAFLALDASAQCPAGQIEINIVVTTDQYGYEAYWELLPSGNACGTGTIASGGNNAVGCNGGGAQAQNPGGYGNNTQIVEGPFCVNIGDTLDLNVVDDWGDGGVGYAVFADTVLIANFPAGWAGNFANLNYWFIARDPAATTPSNDDCANATSIVCPSTVSGTTIGADVDSAGIGSCVVDIEAPGVWYSFAGDGSTVTASFCNAGTNFDTRVSVFQGNCGALTCVAGNDDGPSNPGGCSIAEGAGYNFGSEVSFNTSNGQTYYILVHAFPGFVGEYTMDITCSAPCSPIPGNDDCANAIPLTVYTTGNCVADTGTNFCAVPAITAPVCDPFGTIQDVWYSFNSGSAAEITFNFDSITAGDINFALYADSCGGAQVACQNSAYGSSGLVGFSPNTTYYMQVWNGGGSQEGDFAVCLEVAPAYIDAELTGVNYPTEYTLTPQAFVEPWDLTGTIANVGNQAITNATMTVEVTSNGASFYSGSTAAVDTIQPPLDSTVSITPGYTPPQTANYDILYYIDIAEVDSNLANDTISWFANVTDTVMARDFGSIDGSLGVGLGATATLGNNYTLPTAGNLSSISAFIGGGAVGDTTRFVVYDVVNGVPTNLLANTNEYVLQTGDDAGIFLTMAIQGGPLALSAGDFYVGVEEYASTDNLGIAYSDNIYIPGAAMGNINGAAFDSLENLGGFEVAFIVRANFALSCTLGVTGSATDATCSTSANGAVSITPSGGSSYSYLWSNGATTQNLSNVTAGDYVVTVTETGCNSAVDTFTVGPPAITQTVAITNDLCSTGTGSATVTAAGGTGTLTYGWSNGDNTATASNLMPGTYTVTITDGNMCTYDTAIVILDSVPTFTLTGTITDELCGDTTGAITTSLSGGTMPYTYSWSNGATTADISGLAAGVYTLTYTDANGCSFTNDSTWEVMNNLPNITFSTSQTDEVCGNGSGLLTVSAAGGTAPYTYMWNTGSSATIQNNLSAGTYTVTTTDANGCQDSMTFNLIDTTITIMVSKMVTQATCGNANGSISVTPTNGSPSYQYLWSNGQASSSLMNLDSATYVVTITDGNGCMGVDTTVITNTLGVTVSTSSTNSTCGNADGDATVTVLTGTAPYTYQWDTAAASQTTAMATGLSAGNYNVSVTDTTGCSLATQVSVSDSGTLNATVSSTDASCGGNNGDATVNASGGMMPYTYSWDANASSQTTATATGLTIGNYSVSVEDAAGCLVANTASIGGTTNVAFTTSSTNTNCGSTDGSATASVTTGASPYTYLWSDGQTTQTAINLAQGNIMVTVTDNNGCSDSASVFVNANSVPVVSVTALTNASCNGDANGSISVSISGGTAPYTYVWNDNSDTTNTATTTMAASLSAGIYDLLLTDNTGCFVNFSDTITEPAVLAVSFSSTDALCNGASDGSATATVTGGTMAYNYAWSDGQTTAMATGLAAGVHTLTITDANGCMLSDTTSLGEPTALIGTVGIANITCNGNTDGMAWVGANGGTGAYTYIWSDGSTSDTLMNLTAGTYTFTVTDGNGCTDPATGQVNEPFPLNTATVATDVLCLGDSTGSANVAASGGTPPMDYQWSNGATAQLNTNVPAGTYSVTVTDSQGCSTTDMASVAEPASALTVEVDTVLAETGTGNMDGGIAITVDGGWGGPYTYNWSNSTTNEDLINVSAGDYTVTVTDVEGCEVLVSETIGIDNFVGNQLAGTELNVVPNPSNGSFQVHLTTPRAQVFNLAVYNSMGQVVYTSRLNASGTVVNQLNLSGLDAGVYYLELRNQHGQMLRKVMIQ